MWRNLAKVQSTIQTIGNVVAPALSDDDSEESDGESDGENEGYDDGRHGGEADSFTNQHRSDETLPQVYRNSHAPPRRGSSNSAEGEEEAAFDPLHRQFPRHGPEHEQNEHEQEAPHPQARHRGFGLVGLIAKALDGPYPPSDDDDDDQDRVDDVGDHGNHHGSGGVAPPRYAEDRDSYARAADPPPPPPPRFPRPAVEEEEVQFDAMPHPCSHNYDQPRVLDSYTYPPAREDPAGGTSYEGNGPDEDEDGRVTPPAIATETEDEPPPPQAASSMLDATSSEHNPMRLADPDRLPQPRMFGAHREHGSVSPFGSPKNIRSIPRASNGGSGAATSIHRNSHVVASAGLPPTREEDDEAETTTDDTTLAAGRDGGSGSTRIDQEEDPSPTGRSDSSSGGIVDAIDALLPPLPIEEALPARNAGLPPPPLDSFSAAAQPPPVPTTEASEGDPTRGGAPEVPPLSPAPPPLLVAKSSRPAISTTSVIDEHSTASTCPATEEPQQQQQQQEQRQRERKLERRCRELEDQLLQAEARIQVLDDAAALSQVTLANSERDAMDRLRVEFQEKEARIMAAAAEDHEQELRFLANDAEIKVQSLRQEMAQERDVFEREREYFEQLVAEANARAEQAERQYQRERTQQESSMNQSQKHHDRELHMQAEKLAETMALLDEREDQVSQLKALVQSLQAKLSEHAEGTQLAEEEVEELQHENEELRQAVQRLDNTCKDLQKKNAELHADSNKLSELKLELRLLKEERDRERVKSQTESAVAHGSRAQVEDERDAAIAQAHDLQQQLAAVLADLAMAKSDVERTLVARNNLQMALESFQGEREAELAMLEEQRLETERSIKAAHAAAMEAMREANEANLRDIQRAADASVRHSMEEIQLLESKLAAFKSENVQMRRSLDEAIHRLQATQEDVIDRTLMKNILMDWLTKTGTKERKDVLELMASVLHFTEEEKERVHIGPHAGALEKVVHSVAAPLPPSKADVEHLAGDTVREKWVNFLLAETDD